MFLEKKIDLLLHISFTSLLIRKCNLYLHKPAGYFLTGLCDLYIFALVINILSRCETCLFVKMHIYMTMCRGRGSAARCTEGKCRCKLVLLAMTGQVGEERDNYVAPGASLYYHSSVHHILRLRASYLMTISFLFIPY